MTSVLADVADVTGTARRPRCAGRPLRVWRCRPTVGAAYWRWDCRQCGEYGGAVGHPDALARARRHCAEHPRHRSALVPPERCREAPPLLHPALLVPPGPLEIHDEPADHAVVTLDQLLAPRPVLDGEIIAGDNGADLVIVRRSSLLPLAAVASARPAVPAPVRGQGRPVTDRP